MRITKIVENYKFLFLLTFVLVAIILMFYDISLLDIFIASTVFSVVAVTIKYCCDKIFDKWFSKDK